MGDQDSCRQEKLTAALDLCLERLEGMRGLPGFPYATRAGRWLLTQPHETGFMPANPTWVVGFLPGMLWLAYRVTKLTFYADEAIERCARFLHRKDDDSTHDLGFVFYPSYVQGFALTGERWLRDGAVAAARSLARRFNPRGRFLRAWGPLGSADRAGQTTIDAMMNLGLLYWAAEHGGDPTMAEAATAHAETTAKHLVRGDGTTYHVYEFDPASGAPVRGFTHQGYDDGSTWARGQGWGIYGFARTCRQSGSAGFKQTAAQLANWTLDHLPADGIPYWDFADPAIPNAPRDSSAGAIIAAGLLDLADCEDDQAVRERYRAAAGKLLTQLYDGAGTHGLSDQQGILCHGTWHKKAGFAVDESLIFGDYYFMEALVRYLA